MHDKPDVLVEMGIIKVNMVMENIILVVMGEGNSDMKIYCGHLNVTLDNNFFGGLTANCIEL